MSDLRSEARRFDLEQRELEQLFADTQPDHGPVDDWEYETTRDYYDRHARQHAAGVALVCFGAVVVILALYGLFWGLAHWAEPWLRVLRTLR